MTFRPAIESWEPVGSVPLADLFAARLEGQWAARIVGAVGERSARTPLPDYGHIALTLEAGGWALGAVTEKGIRVGLQLEELVFGVFGEDGLLRDRIVLAGLSVDAAAVALGKALGMAAAEPSRTEIEEHPLGNGAAFGQRSAAAAAEFGRWFRNGDRFVRALVASSDEASPARIWPHHFDLATLLPLDPPGTAEPRSIGFGLSPGDTSYPEPYFYTSPWPITPDAALDELEGSGHWHREGFVSAILPARALGADPGRQVDSYLDSALAACRRALSRD